MAHYVVELTTRMTVLRSCITDGNTLLRLGHGTYVERETIGMVLAKSPHLIGYG